MQDLQTTTNPSNPTTPKPPRSPAQIAASLANGKKSKGPTSPAGRQKCAYAATSRFKHHQLAETILLTGESRPNFVALLESYIDTFQPLTEPEHNVIQQMVVAYWHKLRAWSTHQVAFNCEIARQDPTLPDPIKAAEAERVIHVHPKINTFDRQYRNAMRDLKLLRDLRGLTTGLPAIPVPIATTVYPGKNQNLD